MDIAWRRWLLLSGNGQCLAGLKHANWRYPTGTFTWTWYLCLINLCSICSAVYEWQRSIPLYWYKYDKWNRRGRTVSIQDWLWCAEGHDIIWILLNRYTSVSPPSRTRNRKNTGSTWLSMRTSYTLHLRVEYDRLFGCSTVIPICCII